MLRVYLFGGLDLVWDECPLPALPGAAVRSLLAYLLVHRDRPHTRDLLTGTFWPDLPEATARRRLSQALWQIHRFWRELPAIAGIGSVPLPPLLLAAADTVQIHPALPLWLDVEEFDRQHTRCAVDSADSSGSLESAARCLDLYRGELLAGYYDDWIIPEREGLRGKLLQALERQLQVLKGRGEHERALVCARRLVAEDSWREEAHREVMCLCHLLSRDDEALRQYETCCQVLARDLGSPPSSGTAALAEEIALRAGLPAPALLPAMPRSLATPLLERPDQLPLAGRRAELAELVRWLESAAQGSGGLAIVYGEAGVGKSRLLRELAANARWRGVRAAWGRCYELAAPLTYQPLVEALRAELPVLSAATLPPPWRGELARLLPELAAGGPTPPPPVQQEEAGRLLEAIARAFLALAAAAPLLLILEDAQWMDSASLEALRYLLPRLADAPLLIVISVRSEELAGRPATLLAAMERTRLAHRVELGRLDRAETAELVWRALDLQQPAPRFSARLYAETEGNPFFLVETLCALVQEGVLTRDEAGGWGTPWDHSTDDYAELPLPAGIVQSITHRLECLPAALLDLLHLAAVIGRDVDFRLWLAASGCTEEQLLAAGDEVCARGLLLAAPERKAPPGQAAASDYTFAHDLIRRVSYERLSAPRRRAYHRRVATALTRLAPDEPAALAYHWTQAEVWDRAASDHRRAGDRARAVYAHADAAAHYTQALQSLERLAGPADLRQRYDLHLAREAAYNLLGDRGAQAEDLQRLAELAAALGDDAMCAEAALRRAEAANATGSPQAAMASAQEAIRLAAAAGDVNREVAGYLQWGSALLHQGEFALARPRIETAVTIARRERLPLAEVEGLRHLGSVDWCLGDYEQARVYYEQSLCLGREIGDRRGESMAHNNLGLVHWRQGDYQQALLHVEQSLRIAREMGDLWGESKSLSNLSGIALDTGDLLQSQAYAEQALEIARKVDNRPSQGVLLLYLGNVAGRQGDYVRARAYDEQALDMLREIGDRRLQGAALNNLGEHSLYAGCYLRAREYLEEALAISREMGDRQSECPCLQDLGAAWHSLGAYSRAAACYEQALQISREIGDAAREGATLVSLGRLAGDMGDHEAAHDNCRQALAIAGRVGGRPAEAQALTHLGQVLTDCGELEEAAVTHEQALAIRRQLGQAHLTAESLAGLARCAAAQGHFSRAQAAVEEILAHLREKALDGTDEPLRIYLTCYRVLRAGQDPRAAGILRTAYGVLQERAAQIVEDELRQMFLGQVEAHRQIVAAYHELRPAEPALQVVVTLPRTDVPLGRPLRPDEFVTVVWTVAAPEDEEPQGKVARRQRRILRLLAEAQAQGAAPRDEDLARALEVSLVTVRRDMAALRAAGHGLPRRQRGQR
jgi:DNA-binding SARP family transcriptional activator/tetratricopeptide (TPR) repeat protein